MGYGKDLWVFIYHMNPKSPHFSWDNDNNITTFFNSKIQPLNLESQYGSLHTSC